METICYQREEATLPLLSKVHLQLETEVELERGRAEAKVQALEKDLSVRAMQQEEYKSRKANFINSLTATSTMLRSLLASLNRLSVDNLPTVPQMPDQVDISFQYEQTLTATLDETRKALKAGLLSLDEQGTREVLDNALNEQGRINQQREAIENDMKRSQQAVITIFSYREIASPSTFTYESIVTCWPFIRLVSSNEEGQVSANLE